MKQTALKWLYDQIENKGKCIYEVIEQAKAMEKEQMCKFAYKCHNHYKVNGDFKIENYYNETFKSE